MPTSSARRFGGLAACSTIANPRDTNASSFYKLSAHVIISKEVVGQKAAQAVRQNDVRIERLDRRGQSRTEVFAQVVADNRLRDHSRVPSADVFEAVQRFKCPKGGGPSGPRASKSFRRCRGRHPSRVSVWLTRGLTGGQRGWLLASCPDSGREFRDTLDGEVGQPGQHQAPAGFDGTSG
jgi:hypothetical protein